MCWYCVFRYWPCPPAHVFGPEISLDHTCLNRGQVSGNAPVEAQTTMTLVCEWLAIYALAPLACTRWITRLNDEPGDYTVEDDSIVVAYQSRSV